MTRTAGWRASARVHGNRTSERDIRPALFVCLLLVSDYGRGLRMVAGALVIALGAAAGGGFLTAILASLGLIMLLDAQFDLCLAAPLLGCPADGAAIRRRAASAL